MATKSVSVAPVLLANSWKQDDTNYYRIRLTLSGKSKYIKTNIVIHRDQLDRKGKPKDVTTRHKVEEVVRQAEEVLMKIDSYALAGMTVDQVANYLEKVHDGAFRLDIFSFARDLLETKPKSSRGCYTSAMNSFRDFVETDSFDIGDITSSLLRRWEQWLRKKYGDEARAVSSYTAAMRYIHGQARALHNNEETGHVPIRNPFQFYKPPTQIPAEHRDVDPSVIDRMLELRESLSGRERIGVDLFLISFAFMGMNCPDLYKCTKPKDGIITYNRTKTKKKRRDHAKMRVRIEKAAQRLVEEYAGQGDRLFDFSERYSAYENLGKAANVGLKRFCERIKYNDELTVYSARHTWATVAYSCRIDKGVINDCICHVDKSMSVTDLYIHKDWEVMWEANEKVLSKFRWP